MKKVIEALGMTWTFSENSEMADMERKEMEHAVSVFALSGGKPSEKRLTYGLLAGYYPDTMSSLESLTGPDIEEGFEFNLVESVGDFFNFVKEAYKANSFGEIRKLRDAAVECNPQWYPVNPLEGATEEVGEALGTLEETQSQLDLDNTSDEAIDPAAVQDASATVVGFAEGKAKEAGKIGPATFPDKAKRRPRNQ